MICKPSTCLPEPAADCSPISSSDTRQSEQLSLIPTAAPSCENAPPMDGSPACTCTKETFGCLIHPNTPAEWVASMRGSLASLIQSLGSESEKLTNVIYGPTPQGLLASYDHDSHSWKTCQESLLPDTSGPSSETLPRWGMTRAGRLYPLPMLALRTFASGGGVLPKWPTPMANDAEKRGDFDATNKRNGLPAAVKLWPTPTSTLGSKGGRVTPRKSREGGTLIEAVSARAFPTPSSNDWKGSSKGGQRRGQLTDPDMGAIPAGGKLNPTWVEWLMYWPLAWTLIPVEAVRKLHAYKRAKKDSKHSVTAKSRSRRRSRGESSGGHE